MTAISLSDGFQNTIASARDNRDTIRRYMLQHANYLPEVCEAIG